MLSDQHGGRPAEIDLHRMAGEVLVGPKRLYLLDEPTTGLDSSTAYRLVSSIREFVHKDKVRPLLPLASLPEERTSWV